MSDPMACVCVRGAMAVTQHGVKVTIVQVPKTDFWICVRVFGKHSASFSTGSDFLEGHHLLKSGGIMKGSDMGFLILQRKKMMKWIDFILRQLDEEEEGLEDALLDYEWTLVQEVLWSIRKCCAARAIQRAFRQAISNPAYPLCQKRLYREATEMIIV